MPSNYFRLETRAPIGIAPHSSTANSTSLQVTRTLDRNGSSRLVPKAVITTSNEDIRPNGKTTRYGLAQREYEPARDAGTSGESLAGYVIQREAYGVRADYERLVEHCGNHS